MPTLKKQLKTAVKGKQVKPAKTQKAKVSAKTACRGR